MSGNSQAKRGKSGIPLRETVRVLQKVFRSSSYQGSQSAYFLYMATKNGKLCTVAVIQKLIKEIVLNGFHRISLAEAIPNLQKNITSRSHMYSSLSERIPVVPRLKDISNSCMEEIIALLGTPVVGKREILLETSQVPQGDGKAMPREGGRSERMILKLIIYSF